MNGNRTIIRLDVSEDDPCKIARVEYWLERDGKLLAVYTDMVLRPRFAEVANGKAVPLPIEENAN